MYVFDCLLFVRLFHEREILAKIRYYFLICKDSAKFF